jgi:predicted Zn finger-like uncharacterized protein
MSSTTQCPACGTLFKVVVEQLKDTKGWVRCGQCQEVFDAQSHRPELAASQKPSHGLNISFNEAPVGTTSVYTAAAPDIKKDFSSSDWVNSVNPPAPTAKFPAAVANSAAQELEGQAPSFVRQAQRAQRWRSPWVSTGMAVLALLLCTALGLQVARHERDRVAAAVPATLPWLQSLCGITGCTVEPFKHIDAVVVEASSFNKLRNEGSSELYKLGLSLKNNGNLNVAMPHIELSLNDAQDRPLLRRVLSPTDFGSIQPVLAPVTEFAGGTTVQVDTRQLSGARIAGYRVWAFYP